MKFAGILNETGPTLNENAFHSFVVAKQIFLWQLPQLHRCNWQLLVELEAYVVRNMNVSILLGEDFQTTYELSVTRYSSGHCDVAIGRSGRMISAASSHNIDLGFEIQVAYPTQSFIRRKAVAHAKKKDSATKLMEVVALDDTLIQPFSVRTALAVRIDQIVLDLSISFYCIEHGYVKLPKSKVFQHLF